MEDAIAEHETERIGKLSAEEVEAELRAEGIDPARADEVARRALAAADAAAKPPKRRPR